MSSGMSSGRPHPPPRTFKSSDNFGAKKHFKICSTKQGQHELAAWNIPTINCFPNLSQSTLRFVTGPAVTWRKWFRHWNMSRPVPSFQQPNDWNDLKPTTRCKFARKHKQPSRSSINIFHHLNNTEPLGAAFQFSPLTAAIRSMIDFSVISFLPLTVAHFTVALASFCSSCAFSLLPTIFSRFLRLLSSEFRRWILHSADEKSCMSSSSSLESFSHLNSISLKMATRRQWTTLEHFFKKIKFSC